MNYSLLGCIAALTLVVQFASAREFVVPANTPRNIFHRYAVNENCSSVGEVVIRITTQPVHGAVTIRRGRDYPRFKAPNARVVCNSRSVQSTQVWYTPERGYVGPDSVTVDVIWPWGSEEQDTITILVR